MVEKRLAFALPSDFRWLTAKIVGTSSNVKATLTIQDSSLVFSTGLFRCNESIRFQAIAEAPIGDASCAKKSETIEERFDKAILITHRIADTQKVVSLDLTSSRQAKRRMLRVFVLALVVTAMMVMTIGAIMYVGGGFPAETHFIVADTNAIPHEVYTKPRLDGTMTLKGVDDDFRKQVTVEEFFSHGPLNAKVVASSGIKGIIIISLLYILIPWAMFLYAYRKWRRSDKFHRLLGIEDHQDNQTKKSTGT